ncbi:MAG: hypothetical protein V2A76_05125, partial [Planctomycetota bacterium]
ALAGPALVLKAKALSTAVVSAQEVQKVKIPGPGMLQIAAEAVLPGQRVRVIDPQGLPILVDQIDARRKLTLRIEQAGTYSIVLPRRSTGGAGGASAQAEATAVKARCGFGHVSPRVRIILRFDTASASRAAAADAKRRTGGDCTGGLPYCQQGTANAALPQRLALP